MSNYENYKPNRTQAIGLFFMVISVFSLLGGWAWVSAYWDTDLAETYRGYDIHYFPNIHIYGIDIGGPSSEWVYLGNQETARNKIDLWVDGPITVGTYRDFTIYQLPGHDLYYGENGLMGTQIYINTTALESYIDTVYYPTRICTIHKGTEGNYDEYKIYRQGLEGSPVELTYWVQLDGITLEYFDTKAAARAYVADRADPTPEAPLIEIPENPDTPADNEAIPEGDYSMVDNLVDQVTDVIDYVTGAGTSASGSSEDQRTDTIGAFMVERQTMITALTGSLGAGLMVLGSIKRDEK